MTVSAEGRVENQKLNQTAALLSFGSVFGFQLDSLEKNLLTLAVVTFNQHIDQSWCSCHDFFQAKNYFRELRKLTLPVPGVDKAL